MKPFFFLITLLLSTLCTTAQDSTSLMHEAATFERQLKEPQAIEKYVQALHMQPSNILAAVKCATLNCVLGALQADPILKKKYFIDAKNYADSAISINPRDADANYITAMAYSRLAEVETNNNKLAEYIKGMKSYADKAISINASHGKSWYIIGKWHYDLLTLGNLKKAAMGLLYGGGLSKANIEDAIASFEKCKMLEPYLVMNHFALAQAYYSNKQYEKSLAALQQCIKCPTFSSWDKVLKAEAKKLLVQWQ